MSIEKQIRLYGNIRLLDIEAVQPEQWDTDNATHVRVFMPANSAYEVEMQRKGFLLADRTVGVSITLSKYRPDLVKLVRMEVIETDAYKDDIFEIARASFPYDRRFHIIPECTQEVKDMVLAEWFRDIDKANVCLYKGEPVGFLVLKQTEPDTLFIHLAAVLEKYRITGAAMSLYAKAVLTAIEHGMKKLNGRISTQNTAVMNLYAYLGASFTDPVDIYLKEIEHGT